jgi:hypothetical protein
MVIIQALFFSRFGFSLSLRPGPSARFEVFVPGVPSRLVHR